MAKSKRTRDAQEAAEGLPTVRTEVPAARMQQDQQVTAPMDAEHVSGPEVSYEKKKSQMGTSSVKQDRVARVLASDPAGEVPMSGLSLARVSYGGNTDSIAGSSAYTPIAEQSRSRGRLGKKLDSTAKHLNFIPSEQVILERDESKPIAESHESQGFNGTYRNENARAQKNNGAVPSATLFMRSVDEIVRDQMYFVQGQVVKQDGVQYADVPTMSTTIDPETGVASLPTRENFTNVKRSNYLHHTLHVKFDSGTGELTDFYFTGGSDDGALELPVTVSARMANKSSVHELTDLNRVELYRQRMDAKAGDENSNFWTPLPRAVRQPSQTLMLLHDIEAQTGAEVFMAYKKTAAALSYQLNRAAKDGLTVGWPGYEALAGLCVSDVECDPTKTVQDAFSAAAYKAGCAALMIGAFDTVAKYKTKADILIQAKGIRQYMQIADNNMNPLRVPAEFVQVVNNREVFSTIDRDYDPLMPVCISDRAYLIHTYDWNQFGCIKGGKAINTQAPFRYSYHDLRNVYTVAVEHPLIKGLMEYFRANAGSFINPRTSDGQSVGTNPEYAIPVVHSTRFFSTWSLLLLAATPFIIRERINSLRDVLYYEGGAEYPFADLISIKDANPMDAVNYSNPDYSEPLHVGRMMPSTALSWVMPEVFWPFDEETVDDTYKMVLPWYFSENEFTFDATSISADDSQAAMTLPSIRSGIRLSFADMLYSMSERDLRLSLDRMVDIPKGAKEGAGEVGVYKYDQMSDGIPFATYSKSALTVASFLEVPRELGTFVVAPIGLKVSDHEASTDFWNGEPIDLSESPIYGSSSYMLRYWFGVIPQGSGAKNDGKTETILKPGQINVDRSTAYVQVWSSYSASILEDDYQTNIGWTPGLELCFNPDGTPIAGQALFHPFTNGVSDEDGITGQNQLTGADYSVISLQKGLWARVQMLPFVISPFDTAASLTGKSLSESSTAFDPFDLLYIFGGCGFRASDYTLDVYDRSNRIVNQGNTFISDPWIEASPIIRESKRLTQSEEVAPIQS